jgi:hypothetical protein
MHAEERSMMCEILSASDRANWPVSLARPSGKTQKGEIPMKGKKSGKTSGQLPTDEQIKQRAYELFLARGATHGHDVEDWLRAQAELREAADGTDAASERPATHRSLGPSSPLIGIPSHGTRRFVQR